MIATSPVDSGYFGRSATAFDAGDLHFFHGLAMLHEPQAFAAHLAPARQAEWRISDAVAERPFFEHYAFYLGAPYGRILPLDMQVFTCI